MTTATILNGWLDATAALRASLIEENYERLIADAKAARKGKVKDENLITPAVKEKARFEAKAEAKKTLYWTPEVNGVQNPYRHDPVWGWGEETPEQATATFVAEDVDGNGLTADAFADLVSFLKAQTWSDFATSLAEQGARKGTLSPKQVSAALKMRAKVEAKSTTANVRSNRYAGTCLSCRGEVAAEAGRIEKAENGRWVTYHLEGECLTAAEVAEDAIDLSDLRSGKYAVPGGDTRLKLRISRSKGNGSTPAGTIFVSDDAEYGSRKNYGRQDVDGLYRGEVKDALRAILADPKAAMVAYGQLVGVCGNCGRRLEDEESVRAGIGPICAQSWGE